MNSTFKKFSKNRSNLIIAAVLFVSFFSFFYYTSSSFEQIYHEKNIFGSDTNENLDSMKKFSIGFDTRKHPLFSAITSSLFQITNFLLPIDENNAVSIVLSLIAAINLVLSYIILNHFIKKNEIAILFTILYGILFSNLVFFSIPETYSLTSMVILIYSYCFIKIKNNFNFKRVISLSIISGLATLFNPPLIFLVIPSCYMFYKMSSFKKTVLASSTNIVITILTFIISNIILFGKKFYLFFFYYGKKYCSLANFINLKSIINVSGIFLLFSVISPFHRFSGSTYFIEDVWGYFHSITSIILLLVYVLFLCIVANYMIRNRNIILDSFFFWIIMMIVFHIYFNPWEAILYSSQVLFPLILISTYVFDKIEFKNKYVILITFIILMIINNLLFIRI